MFSWITHFVSDPHQSKNVAFFSLLSSNQAYVELRAGVKRHVCFAYIVKSKTRSKQKRVIQSDQNVQVCENIFFCGGWMNSFAWSFFLLYFPWMWTIFLFSFLTCHVGIWHTFFGYESLLYFFLFLTCLLSMWHTFFGYASFISFCIANILYGHFRKKESWYDMEFYYVGGW